MTPIQFLAEWALRSSILIAGGALLLAALRVKDPSTRLAAWTAMLLGSLVIPALTAALPGVPLVVMRGQARPTEAPAPPGRSAPVASASFEPTRTPQVSAAVSRPFDWARVALVVYLLAALALLLRLCAGFAMSLRLLRRSRATGRGSDGIEIRESDGVTAPVTLGIARPAIVLPADWREWGAAKLDAVLAHESSHVRRHDPAVQLLSAIHRALLWHSPLSWFLHTRIVRLAEEASDDAAVAAIRDRGFYAEVLLGFIQRGVRRENWLGVPMARYGRPDRRIHRILDGTTLSRGVTRWTVAAILALGSPLAYLAAAHPQHARLALPGATKEASARALALAGPRGPNAAAVSTPATSAGSSQLLAQAATRPLPKAKSGSAHMELTGIGEVKANTVVVRPAIDGQLMSVSFKEGDEVQAGQLLASMDVRRFRVLLDQARGELARDQASLQNAESELAREEKLVEQKAVPNEQLAAQRAAVERLEDSVKLHQAQVEDAQMQMTYGEIRAPITGIAGLLLVDPGNIVHPTDAIVTINQVTPIAVVFQVPEDRLPQVRELLRRGVSVTAEAWNRDNSAKLATGRLIAVDNQIDPQTGTAKLKAEFDNKDGVLFPNQFVNVHMLSAAQ